MSSDFKDEDLEAYKEDARIPCQYGTKCYQKNPAHHSKYKHPRKVQKGERNVKAVTNESKKRNRESDEDNGKVRDSISHDKVRRTESILSFFKFDRAQSNSDSDKSGRAESGRNDVSETLVRDKDNEERVSCVASKDDKKDNVQDIVLQPTYKETDIPDLFLVDMPQDFYQFYEFCRVISQEDPSKALKAVCLKLVGPYDILSDNRNCSKVTDKEKWLRHWRYYYDPPEFQTVISGDKDGLHFGYWRDNVDEKAVFVAKNKANIDCSIQPVAENLFGAMNAYMEEKIKTANPFQKSSIVQLHRRLKDFAKEKDITLDKNTIDMRKREKTVVAKTFHRAGIVVPYNKKTQLGYRDLAVTDSELRKILKAIDEAGSSEERRTPMTKLQEVVRLAIIAADECDFGTCLELAHDLFSSGSSHVQNMALQMFSVAYSHLQRPELLTIVTAHLKDRKRGSDLSVF